ncbi:MAG: mobilization protein [Faecalimonas sp.]|uniref:Mobilization protein n=1 Tax=Velocimicrobium porci TaxID=2606634 RepID=A0A6L5Y1I7_9FIRM|nr:mobilization protein [Velocimicrobium porci]MDY2996730.1 mobilization protein [Faecalimonas sp.]MSS64862.1 mobilization protein [Velocimicrobium porci]
MEKSLDAKGRWRNRNVGFRVSEEEAKLLDDLVELSGLAKQDYILRRLLNREVVVQGNPKVFKALKNQMTQIYEELKRLESVSDDNEELLIVVEMVAKIMKGMVNEYDG